MSHSCDSKVGAYLHGSQHNRLENRLVVHFCDAVRHLIINLLLLADAARANRAGRRIVPLAIAQLCLDLGLGLELGLGLI